VNGSDPTGLSGNPEDVLCSGGGTPQQCQAAEENAQQVAASECSDGTVAACPSPPSSSTSYNYSFDLGPLGTPQVVAGFTRADCPVVFPIQGCTSDFTVGERLNLHESVLFGLYTQGFPVQVVALGATSWTFKALYGHPEGQGRTITFSFGYGSSCQDVTLDVRTSSNGSAVTQWWGVRSVDFFIAKLTWERFASNIEANYEYNEG
jgi:hypothetical protein